jgi:hypothetical protein
VSFGLFAEFLLVDHDDIFLLFLLGEQQFSFVVLAFLPDLGRLPLKARLALLDGALLGDGYLLLGVGHGLLTRALRFAKLFLVLLSHGVVLLHPTLAFQLTLVPDEVEAVEPLLALLLMGEFELDLLQRHIFSQLLDFELELDLQDLVLLVPLGTSIAISHVN